MERSFVDILMQKILDRQQLEARPRATLDPRLHPSEVMELELLSRLHRPSVKAASSPAGPYKAKTTPRRQKAPTLGLAEASVRPRPVLPMGASEVLAKELFQRLGVPLHEQPLAEELTKAYRKLAFAYHPDQSSRPGTEEIFRDLTAAYQALKRWAQKAYPR